MTIFNLIVSTALELCPAELIFGSSKEGQLCNTDIRNKIHFRTNGVLCLCLCFFRSTKRKSAYGFFLWISRLQQHKVKLFMALSLAFENCTFRDIILRVPDNCASLPIFYFIAFTCPFLGTSRLKFYLQLLNSFVSSI